MLIRVQWECHLKKLEQFLSLNTEIKDNSCFNKMSRKKIAACVPMHTFGHPLKIDQISEICDKYNILMIEDSAESLGSFYKNKHTGTFGKAGILSFNGNKPVTTGGGGMIITDDNRLAEKIRHLSTTAKKKHSWEFFHDESAFNLRMPNINAAVGCAQMEYLDLILKDKRSLSNSYKKFFNSIDVDFFVEPENCRSNYWLNAIITNDKNERDVFLEFSNKNNIQVRPIWVLMNKLPMYKNYVHGNLENSMWFEERVVNIPSSMRRKL